MVFREISFWNENVSLLNKNGNVYCWWIVIDSPRVNAENCKLYDAFNKRLHDGFARHLHVIWLCFAVCSSNGKKWVKVRLLLSKPCSFFIQLYLSILHKESSTSLKQCPAAEFHGENVKGNWFNVNDCHGAIYNALTSGVNGLRSNSRLRKLFFFGCVFFKHFRFLADLNYTSTLTIKGHYLLSFLNQLIHKLAIGPLWFFSNLLTSLMSEKNFLIYKIIISTQRLILVRYSWTVQVQGTVAVDSSSRNLHSFALLGWYFASKS